MNIKYRSVNFPVPAEMVRRELERLRRAHHGKLKPRQIVQAARQKSSLLHLLFPWDDAVAAERYRLIRARMIIRQIVVEEADQTPFPAFVRIKSTDDTYYQSTEAAVASGGEIVLAVRQLAEKLLLAQRAVEEVRRYTENRQDREQILGVIQEALATAKMALSQLPGIH